MIAVEAPAYSANDLTGTGAKVTAGRWNSKGTPLVYCATNIALATLETVHYLQSGGLPFNRYTLLALPLLLLVTANLAWMAVVLGTLGARFRDFEFMLGAAMPYKS